MSNGMMLVTRCWLNQVAIFKHSLLGPPVTCCSGPCIGYAISRMYHFHISLGMGCNLLASTVNWPVDGSAD